jgi:hypothetical protein
MAPVEFLQGSDSHSFSSPENPPLCQTLAGLPLTYNADYNAETGFTTFQILGQSPSCACLLNPVSGLLTPEQCAINEAELARYEDTYTEFTGDTFPPKSEKTFLVTMDILKWPSCWPISTNRAPTSSAETLSMGFPTPWPPILIGRPRFLISNATGSHVTILPIAKVWIRPFLRLLINAVEPLLILTQ